MRWLAYIPALFISLSSWSQSTQFNRIYNFNGLQEKAANVATMDDGYILVGNTFGNRFTCLISKLNPLGDTIWVKRYNAFDRYSVPSYFQNTSINNNGITITGWIKDSLNIPHPFISQFSQQGQLLWEDTLALQANFNCIVATKNRYYAAGIDRTQTHLDQFLVCKYTTQGTLLWAERYGLFNKDENCYNMSVDNNGDVILGGHSGNHPYIVKIDSNGNELWDKTFELSNFDSYPARVFTDDQDNIYVTAGAAESNVGSEIYRRMWICKLNSQGNKIWEKSLGESSIYCAASSIKQRRNGNLLCLFSSQFQGDSIGPRIARIYELDTAGNEINNIELAHDTINYDSPQQAFSIDTTLDNGFIIGGHFEESAIRLWVVKFDSNGCYDSTFNCALGIQDPSLQYHSLKIFPNPAQAQISVLGDGDFIVYNSLGQQITVPSHVSENTTTFNIQHLPKGVYFMRSKREDEVYIGRFLKE